LRADKSQAQTVSELLNPAFVANNGRLAAKPGYEFPLDFGGFTLRGEPGDAEITSGVLAEIAATVLVLERDHRRSVAGPGQQRQATTISPAIRMMNATGPSPLSCADRSGPHTGHRERTPRKSSNSGPSPQDGQGREGERMARAIGRPAQCSTLASAM
jgi:hypothetical protein